MWGVVRGVGLEVFMDFLTSRLEEEPLPHVYTAYDILHYPSDTRVYVEGEGSVRGYVLAWRSGGELHLHVWGRVDNLEALRELGVCNTRTVIQVYNEDLLGRLTRIVAGCHCDCEVKWFLDMAVDEGSFKPHRAPGVRVRSLSPLRRSDVESLARLRGISLERAESLTRTLRYHGLFVGERLVSVAGSCIRMPTAWVVCDVYTHPEFRGRGYAKAVTSSVVGSALSAGALALLHVEEDNRAAVRAYEALGFKVVARRPWLMCRRAKSGS